MRVISGFRFSRLLASLVFLCGGFSPAYADSLTGTVVIKDAHGELSVESRQVVLDWKRRVQNAGPIHLWIGFEMEFQGNPDLRTDEIAAQEANVKREIMESVILPLADLGFVQVVPMTVALDGAPGIMLEVGVPGLNRLVRLDEVAHMGFRPRY